MAHRPRVLWLHTQPEHYFNCMMDELSRTSDADYIAAFSYQGEGLYQEIPVPRLAQTVFLKPRPGMDRKPIPSFGKFHADWKADLLPLHYDAVIVSGYAWRTQREVIQDAHNRGIPVAMWSDSNLRSQRGHSLSARLKRSIKRRFLSGIIRKTDWLLTANTRGVAYWRYFGAPRHKIVLTPCYADYPRIDSAKKLDRSAILAKAGLTADARVLYTAARLVNAKGLDLAIKAFLASGLQSRGWFFLIAGTGPLERDLKALAGNELGKSIRFLGFQQPEDNLAYMAHADLFILPSRYEPHGIVVGESLAAGTPVLASSVVGLALELVKPGISGAIFRTQDAEDLRQELLKLAEPGKLAAMRPVARTTFEQWFAKTSPIKVVPALVKKMLAQSNGKKSQ